MRIRNKILIFFIPLAVTSVVAMALFSRRAVESELVQEVIKRGQSISLRLVQSPEMITNFQSGNEKQLLPPLQKMMKNAGAVYAVVLDTNGRVLTHTNVVEKGKLYRDTFTIKVVKSEFSEHGKMEIDGKPVMDISTPVWEREETIAGEEFLLTGKKEAGRKKRLATLRLGLPLEEVLNRADQISNQVFWIITLVVLLAVALTLFYVEKILLPVRLIARAAEAIGQGGVGETVPVLSKDEMGDLARSFNRMSRDLAATTVSKNLLDSILRNMQDILVIADAQGNNRLCNKSVLDLLQYEESELLDQSIACLLPPDSTLFEAEGLEKLLEQKALGNLELSFVTSRGEHVPLLLSVAALVDRAEQIDGFVVTARDITQRVKAEKELKSSLEEKEVLLKEIHHRVKNNLQVISSLLNLQARQVNDDKALEMFDDSKNRVRTMALIHEKLYKSEDLAQIDFGEYIHSLVQSLFEAYRDRGRNIRAQIDVENVLMGVDQGIPCGLIVNELVSNSLKHAFPGDRRGSIWISLSTVSEGKYILRIRDDGIGFPPVVDFGNSKSLGLRLVKILVGQLGGDVKLDSGEFTDFRIEFSQQV